MVQQVLSPEEERYLQGYDDAIAQANQSMGGMNQPYSPAMFGAGNKQNLVEWQLDFRAELEDIERLLRCDVLIRNKDGQEAWIENPEQAFVLFNQRGVSDIIREIRMFLNKNKVLSNYAVNEIQPRIRMLGHELRSLIYNNYENYGIDNEYKMNNYPIVVLTIISMIEDAFRRAINGGERRDLNSARIVQQNDSMMPQMPNVNMNMYSGGGNKNKNKHWYAPWSWGR
jgi:hypothetical protein